MSEKPSKNTNNSAATFARVTNVVRNKCYDVVLVPYGRIW